MLQEEDGTFFVIFYYITLKSWIERDIPSFADKKISEKHPSAIYAHCMTYNNILTMEIINGLEPCFKYYVDAVV